MIRALAFAFALLATACGAPSEKQSPPIGVAITGAWAAPTPGGVDVSAGYLTIANLRGEDDTLIAASSPRATRVELHEMAMEAEMMQMRQIETLTIPAGGEAAFAPGGRHLMFVGVTEPFVLGQEIPVRLVFENAGEIDVALPVRARASGGH